MLIIVVVVALILSGCGEGSPTEPTTVTPTPPATATPAPTPSPTPAPTPNPAPTTPAPNPLLSDPRFDRAFYRQFVRNGYEQPQALQPLRRQTQAPRIYLRTHDDSGSPIDALTLDSTAAALIAVTGQLTGVFGLAGLERGTGDRLGQPGWVTVSWDAGRDPQNACGRAAVGGPQLVLYPRSSGCRCAGGPAIKPLIVKHEMGHILGFWHTDAFSDLMHNGGHSACDMTPSDREIFHARVAYSMPVGSLDP